MKLSSLFVAGILIVALAVMLAPVVKADGLPPGDPIIKAAGAGVDAPAPVAFQDFAISSATGTSPGTSKCALTEPFPGGGVILSPNCQFQNDLVDDDGNGLVIDALVFDLPGVPNDANLNCSPIIDGDVQIFSTCTKEGDGSGGTVVTFTGGGIAYGQIFTLDLEGFVAGFQSGATAQTPEPGVLMLLLAGFVGLIGFGLKRSAVRA